MGSRVRKDDLLLENAEIKRLLYEISVSDEESYEGLMDYLLDTLTCDARLISPVVFSGEEGSVQIPAIECMGKRFLAAYTDFDAIDSEDSFDTVIFSFGELAEYALDDEKCSGIVLNPMDDAVFLLRGDLEYMTSISGTYVEQTRDVIWFEKGREAYFEGLYYHAFKYYSMAAEEGNVEAMCGLGYCFYYGRGVKEDKFIAFEYWTRAALLDDIEAMYRLGDMYMNGDIAKDTEFAKRLYNKAFMMLMEGDGSDTFTFSDVFLRILRHCSEQFDLEILKGIADDCVSGFEYRMENCDVPGVAPSEEDLAEAREFQSMLQD